MLAAALRAKSGVKSGPPPLAGIFGYIDNQGTGFVGGTPNQHDGGEAGLGTTALGVNYADPQANNGADGNMPQAPLTFKPPAQFAQGITMMPNSTNGEGSGGFRFDVDASKFPQTRFGDVTRSAPVNAHSHLINPNLVYDDPNYGRITDARNIRPDQLNSMAWPALMSLAMAGMGSLGMPSFAGALVNGARGFGSGNMGGGLSALLGAAGGAFGLPSWATSLGRLALAQALRNRGNGG